MSDQEPISLWAKLELMGHKVLAGRVTEAEFAGKGVIRVDVPGPDGATAFTQFFSPDALYCITPLTQEVVLELAKRQATVPVSVYDIHDLVERRVQLRLAALPSPSDYDSSGEGPDDDDGENDDDNIEDD